MFGFESEWTLQDTLLKFKSESFQVLYVYTDIFKASISCLTAYEIFLPGVLLGSSDVYREVDARSHEIMGGHEYIPRCDPQVWRSTANIPRVLWFSAVMSADRWLFR